MNSTSQTDATNPSLLGRARAHDESAWRKLVELYSPLVYHWCRQSGLNSHDAADVMQDTFKSVFTALDRFDRAKTGAFRAWLWTITRNKIRSLARKHVPDAEGGSNAQDRWQNVPADEPAPGDDSVTGERTNSLLLRALEVIRGDFQPNTWTAFERLTLEHRTAAEVGAELGLSPAAVYKARDRVLKRLHEELGDLVSLV